VIDTLRAAAPWQPLRATELNAASAPMRVRVRADDFRIRRFVDKTGSTTIFAVDASGSTALQRLAEAKGAVELLLSDCYLRRARVALIAFRGREAALLLPPTGSLLRAKRALSGLPGGGGTPLAAGIDLARLQAEAVQRRGELPSVVLLTDGRANIALDGQPDRARATEDALVAARAMHAAGIPALLIDTSARPRPQAANVAESMAADYLPLPYVDASRLSGAVRRFTNRRAAVS
jgi:magnesium chelatase subunit D